MIKKPEKPGLYWARLDYYNSWTHIIKIKGKSPFLSYIAWDLRYPLNNSIERNGVTETNKKNNFIDVDPVKFIFAKEIKQNYNRLSEINITENGLYWVIVEKPNENIFSTDVSLAYLSGKVPYLSCFLWNIKDNSKKQILDVSNLHFLKKIKYPE